MKHAAALLILALTLAFAISPAFTDPFSGYRPDQLPIPQTDPPIQPAGYAFAIWGLIYAWLIVSAVYGLWRRPADAGWARVRLPLGLSLALGVPWLAIANASPVWATVVIFGMMGAAVAALIRSPAQDRWWLRAPVAIYAGWLTAASFVSLGATAAGHGLLTGPVGWAFIGIGGALAVALAVLRAVRGAGRGAPEYGLTLIWALAGIAARNGAALPAVTTLALAGAVTVAVAAVLSARRPAAAA